MDKFTLNYSTKNIPLPTRKLYLKHLTDKVEKFIKRVRWKVSFFESDDEIEQKERYGFKTLKCPPAHPDLKIFENDLLDLIKNISFKQIHNDFQRKLQDDIRTINASKNAFIPADKTRNFYELSKAEYDKLYTENVTKTYKIDENSTYESINTEAKDIAKNLDLDERVECMAKKPAFITLKDHKTDFENNPKCRLINPAKSEIGKISKKLLENINKSVREATEVNQWHKSEDTIEWFKNIKSKKNCFFVQFDIEEFYPSITKELLTKSLNFAKRHIDIPEEHEQIILHSRKSLLFTEDNPWVKRSGDPDFDVTMGSFDGAEVCELVGLFILNTLGDKYGRSKSGLYRDDGLSCFLRSLGLPPDKIRKDFIELFKREFDLKITIQSNLQVVHFLDVTFNLKNGTYKPYSKPNNDILYINTNSNHPPNVIKYIPSMISDRISKISSSKRIFKKAAPQYNNALKSSGYKEPITYQKRTNKRPRSRKRKIIWFNPPFSLNVKTNVAKRFLAIVDKNFPKNHKFRKILNRNTLKVSYSCLPNISRIISSHNKKVLSNNQNPTTNDPTATCNCRKNNICPLQGNCLEENVIYQCHIKSTINDPGKFYIGLTGNTFKDRWNTHKYTLRHENATNHTQLSNHYWDLKRSGVTDPILSWEIIDQAASYKNGTKTCNLCLEVIM